jgi:hypothetical protein
MTSGLQLALAGGSLIGLGVALLIWRLAPAQPDLADALGRLSPQHTRRPVTVAATPPDHRDRLGVWALKTFPVVAWARTPTQELAILRIPLGRFYGEKVLYGVVGLCIPPLMSAFFNVVGFPLPLLIPVVATLAMAVLMFLLPDFNARDDAKTARA